MERGLKKVAAGLKFPEGPAYDGKGNVIVSDCRGPYLTRITKDGKASLYLRPASAGSARMTFKKPNGSTFFEDGSQFVCDFGRKAIMRIYPASAGGKQLIYARAWNGRPFRGPNDLAFDPAGNLYFTDPPGSNRKTPIGCVYRVARGTRQVTRVADGLAFPNGIAFAADGRTLYVCESQRSRVLRYRVAPDGSLGDKRVAANLGWGDPDGMAVDRAGNLVVAHFGAGMVHMFRPDGKLLRSIKLPGKQVTNVEFAGRDLRTLYITEAETDAVYTLPMDVPGLPLFCSPKNTG